MVVTLRKSNRSVCSNFKLEKDFPQIFFPPSAPLEAALAIRTRKEF